eukprot:2647351-Pyramimonas_sp.AAC.1
MAAPVEKLMANLQYLDRAGKGLYDVCVNNEWNPILVCKQRLTQLVREGADGDLGPLFESTPFEDHSALLEQVRLLGTDLGAQVMRGRMAPSLQTVERGDFVARGPPIG